MVVFASRLAWRVTRRFRAEARDRRVAAARSARDLARGAGGGVVDDLVIPLGGDRGGRAGDARWHHGALLSGVEAW